MTNSDIKARVLSLISNMELDGFETVSPPRIFAYVFNEIGTTYYLNKVDKGYCLEHHTSEEPLCKGKGSYIDAISTMDNIVKAFDGIKFQFHGHAAFIVADHLLIKFELEYSGKVSISNITVATDISDLEHIADVISKCFSIKDFINDENSYKIAYKGQYSIETSIYKFNKWTTNIEDNYNDDVPYEKMKEVIKDDSDAGLIMLYGKPGTGKTSLIKSLINDNRDTDFIFVDTSIFDSISDGQFLDFIQDNRNAVFVFEDCEKMLMSRDETGNDSIGTILNLTDGIIAESMKIKFICTFNCDVNKVDKALLRKGRLSLKYEFKELSLEKTKKIYPKADKPMTLADAYNAENENDFSKEKRVKIGFG